MSERHKKSICDVSSYGFIIDDELENEKFPISDSEIIEFTKNLSKDTLLQNTYIPVVDNREIIQPVASTSYIQIIDFPIYSNEEDEYGRFVIDGMIGRAGEVTIIEVDDNTFRVFIYARPLSNNAKPQYVKSLFDYGLRNYFDFLKSKYGEYIGQHVLIMKRSDYAMISEHGDINISNNDMFEVFGTALRAADDNDIIINMLFTGRTNYNDIEEEGLCLNHAVNTYINADAYIENLSEDHDDDEDIDSSYDLGCYYIIFTKRNEDISYDILKLHDTTFDLEYIASDDEISKKYNFEICEGGDIQVPGEIIAQILEDKLGYKVSEHMISTPYTLAKFLRKFDMTMSDIFD